MDTCLKREQELESPNSNEQNFYNSGCVCVYIYRTLHICMYNVYMCVCVCARVWLSIIGNDPELMCCSAKKLYSAEIFQWKPTVSNVPNKICGKN